MRTSLLRGGLVSHKGRLLVVGSAVSVSVAIIVLFSGLVLGLYEGVVQPLLPKLPLDLLKVENRTLSIGLLAFDSAKLGGGLDDDAVDRIKEIRGVSEVYPIVAAAFPMRAEGGEGFLGKRMHADVFATGVGPALVRPDVARGYEFADRQTGTVPVIVARRLLDLYNTTIAGAIKKPRLSPEAVVGLRFELVLGSSYTRGTPDPTRVERHVAEIVGLSDHATLIGITVPEQTMRRWNKKFGGGESRVTGAYVKTASPKDASRISQAIEHLGLSVDDTTKMIAAAVSVFMGLGVLFLVAFLVLASLGIAQAFLLIVSERRTEFAILRALGARARDLRRLVLAESLIVGAASSSLGVLLGSLCAVLFESALLSLISDLPVQPERIVHLAPGLLFVCWSIGVLASILGAITPAARAAQSHPSSILRT